MKKESAHPIIMPEGSWKESGGFTKLEWMAGQIAPVWFTRLVTTKGIEEVNAEKMQRLLEDIAEAAANCAEAILNECERRQNA